MEGPGIVGLMPEISRFQYWFHAWWGVVTLESLIP